MATTSADTATPVVAPGNGSAKKTARLNPARRKAAAKAKADAPKISVDNSGPATITSVGSLARRTDKSTAPTSQSDQLKKHPSRPAELARQNTEPAVITRQTTEPAVPVRKPAIQRTITAPEPTTSNNKTLALKAPAIVTGGLVGCAAGAAILLGVGMWYDFSGVESAILTAKSAKLCVDNLTEELITSLKAGTYSGDEALDMLRRTTLAYASTIPEGAPFVERIFREIDMVRKQRGREVDKVVAETYSELSRAGIRGATSAEMRSIVVGQLMKLSKFASSATQDIVIRNPRLRPYREEAAKALSGPPKAKTPTVRVNMAVRQKQAG